MRKEVSDPEPISEKDIVIFFKMFEAFSDPRSYNPPLEPVQREVLLRGLWNMSKELLELAGYGEIMQKAHADVDAYFALQRARDLSLSRIEMKDTLPLDEQDILQLDAHNAFSTPLPLHDYETSVGGMEENYRPVFLAFALLDYEVTQEARNMRIWDKITTGMNNPTSESGE